MTPTPKIHHEMQFLVVHPLDDMVEEKCSSEGLGPMELTRSVRWSLIALRAYLLAMAILLAWHVLSLAGLLRTAHG